VCRCLLAYGANPHRENCNGKNAIDVALNDDVRELMRSEHDAFLLFSHSRAGEFVQARAIPLLILPPLTCGLSIQMCELLSSRPSLARAIESSTGDTLLHALARSPRIPRRARSECIELAMKGGVGLNAMNKE
jgi:hypothetical protein